MEHHVEYNVYEPNRLGKRARAVRFLIFNVTIQNPLELDNQNRHACM